MNPEEFMADINSTGLVFVHSVTEGCGTEWISAVGNIAGSINWFVFEARDHGWFLELFECKASITTETPLKRFAQSYDVTDFDKAAPIIKDCLQRLVQWQPEKFKRSLTFRLYKEHTPPVDGQYLVMYGDEQGNRASKEAELSHGKWVCPYSGQPLADAGGYVLYYVELPEYPFQGAIA